MHHPVFSSLIGAIYWSLINKSVKLKKIVCVNNSEANSGRQSFIQINRKDHLHRNREQQ